MIFEKKYLVILCTRTYHPFTLEYLQMIKFEYIVIYFIVSHIPTFTIYNLVVIYLKKH